jgi:hypothetical protein
LANDKLDAGGYVRQVLKIDSVIEGQSKHGLAMLGDVADSSLVNHIPS